MYKRHIILSIFSLAHAKDYFVSSPDGKFKINYATTDNRISFNIKVSSAKDEWIGFGLSTDGKMKGADMVVVRDGVLNSFIGIERARPQESSAKLENIKILELTEGTIEFQFARPFTNPDFNVQIKEGKDLLMLYAYGPSGNWGYHGREARGVIPASLGGDTNAIGNIVKHKLSLFSVLHGILMLFGWLFLTPTAILLARYLKRLIPNWYIVHRNIQFFTVVIALASVLVILSGNTLIA
ncbi:hypothetical protein ROZALSC1DRAFT_29281 [Rozella allomycis CSF55]|uniref:DOMON domain-containing protein n=1 Tax=Rozella allomycis (strain CSF55) TaxID=988480 RepID=A0A075ARK5_ROZAC|nr:hypothetical protein O9G_000885 [Rozella allomycis CSF55]RKP19093.1 hypothetical protein ROZALSC1DRAFT_29281 [Rozella allomycis CSF55]|eukprot:EPZ32810.1 hypothetical protein O9G_000885 [Rozella allomycis CSF55]